MLQVSGTGGKVLDLPPLIEHWPNAPGMQGRGPVAWSEATCSVYVAPGWAWRIREYVAAKCLELFIP